MGAVDTMNMAMVMGGMNPTMDSANSRPYTGVGVVRIGRRGRKTSAARQLNGIVKVLIYGMVTVRKYDAMDG